MFKNAILALLVVAGSVHAATQSTDVVSESVAQNSGVDNGVYSQSKSNTWVFPAPVMPGAVSGAACTNHGVTSAAIFWNLFSWSTPKHDIDVPCNTREDLKLLTTMCQFKKVAEIQKKYIKQQYGVEVEVSDKVKDLTPEECYKPRETLPPSPPPQKQVVTREVTKTVKTIVLTLDSTTLFEFGKDTLSIAGKQYLIEKLSKFDASKTLVRRVEGHTDNVGTEAYNAALSHRRAESVAVILQSLGFKVDTVVGHGLKAPIAPNTSPEGRAMNRRVHIDLELTDGTTETLIVQN